MAMPNVVFFRSNEPQRLSLRWPDGRSCRGGLLRRYVLTDGRVMFLPAAAARQVDALQLKRGDQVLICKRYERGRVKWEIYRAEGAQPAVAIIGALDRRTDPRSYEHFLSEEGSFA